MIQKSRHIPIRQDWLNLRQEDPIDPLRPIIDAHHHLWDKPNARYLGPDMDADVSSGHSVMASVVVEARVWHDEAAGGGFEAVSETRRLAELAAENDVSTQFKWRMALGIIGYADLTLGKKVGPVLDAHTAAAQGRFRGVRNTSAWHADPEARGSVILPRERLLYEEEFRKGLEALVERGLVFDAWMYHTQLGELLELARAMPELSIVLNHQGGPIGIGPYAGRRAEVFDEWQKAMDTLSCCSNVSVKIGGFGMLMAGFDFHDRALPPTSDELAEAWGPYIRKSIEIFGASRCMLESNFPVDKGTTSYCVLWNAYKKAVAERSDAEITSVMSATANRVYGLGLGELHGGR